MKDKIIITALTLISSATAFAGDLDDVVTQLPEPSTIGLFVAAAIAVTVVTKLKK